MEEHAKVDRPAVATCDKRVIWNVRTVTFWFVMAVMAVMVVSGWGVSRYWFAEEAPSNDSYDAFRVQGGAPAFDLSNIDVEMRDHRGDVVRFDALVGKPTLLLFGFTYCPDVCPTTLAQIATWMAQTDGAELPVRTVFVSVDPERDTVDALSDYVTHFDPRVEGWVGDAEQLRRATKALAAYYEKIPLEDGDYTMDHTALVYMFGADGAFRSTIALGEESEIVAKKLRRLRSPRG